MRVKEVFGDDGEMRLVENPVGKFRVEFKDPDFMWQSKHVCPTDEAMSRLSECHEYFTIELEMDADMVIYSARFLPVKP